jgi:mono/diheme cytochrome c family protein
MRTLINVVLILIVLIVVVAVAGVGFLYARYPNIPPAENITVQATPEKIARGEYLSEHVTGCTVCHAVRDYTKYGAPVKPETIGSGGEFFGDVSAGFAVYSKNITPEGIGDWTDGQLIRAFTAGVNAEGDPLFPTMPYPRYARLSREDVEALVAYVRTLKPIRRTLPERQLPFPLPLIVRTMPQPAQLRPAPAKTDKVAYGEYMTNAAVCAECHTPSDDRGVALPGREFSGGADMKLPSGGIVRPANITPDADTGIGTWSEDDFLAKFRAWRGVEPRALNAQEQRENTYMSWLMYAGMEDDDLRAIYAYLRSLKPVTHRVKKFN